MSSKRTRLTPIFTQGQVGGSVYHLQEGPEGLIFDFGADLQSAGRLLAGRLRTRDSRGIEDPLDLGLLPSFQALYRPDLIADEDSLQEARKLDVSALLLGHGHADHFANVYSLNKAIEIHCHSITAAILLTETACGSGLGSETTHLTERYPHPSEEGLLAKRRSAVRESRPFLLTDTRPSEALRKMWRHLGSDDGLGRSPLVAAGIPFESWPVDHSIWGAACFLMKCAGGDKNIAYASDLRRHGLDGHLTDKFIGRCARLGLCALLLDGSRLGRENDKYVTERECLHAILGAVREAKQRLVIASVSPKHAERLAMILHAARETGRQLVISPKTMYMLEAIGAAMESRDLTTLDGLAVFDAPRLQRYRWHQEVRGRHQDELVTAAQIRSAPGKYIILKSFFETMDWLDVQPYGACYIHANSAAYSDQDRISHGALKSWLKNYRIDTAGISFSGDRCLYNPKFNPSGHMHPKDLEEMLRRIKPEVLIPIHTDRPDLFTEITPKDTRIIIPEQGKTIKF